MTKARYTLPGRRGLFNWTEEEVALLRSAYENAGSGNVGLAGLSERLDRHFANVSRKARELGLTRKGRPQPESARKASSDRARVRIAEGRGLPPTTGMRASEETRAKMRAASQRLVREGRHPGQIPRTDAQRQALSQSMTRRLMEGGNVYSRCRQGKRDDLDGKYFRSAWEANYARYLNLLQRSGHIAGWEYEPQEFTFDTIKRGTRTYLPDFRVTLPNGDTYFVEVKGWMDAKSRVKLARMAKYYPDVVVRLVAKREYTDIARKLGPAIPGWES